MNATEVYAEIMADDNLPSPSNVVVELLHLTRQPEVSIESITRLIAMDPGISARMIRTVNAPTSGLRRTVSSIEQAVTLLGMRAVASIALAVSVLEHNRTGLPDFDYATFWTESLARAVAARVLATKTRSAPPDEAFTYGLLARIGRLALVSVYPEMYRHMLLTLGDTGQEELAEAERAVFAVDAETLSALMLRAWGMSAYHDALASADAESAAMTRSRNLLQTCRAGALVAKLVVRNEVRRKHLAEAMQAMAALGIDAEAVANLFPDIIASYHDAGNCLQVNTPTVPSLAEIYARATDTQE